MEHINKCVESVYPGSMNFKGPMAGGISMNGIETDVLKSALQKYIRRGNLDKSIWCILEMDLFSEILFRENDEKKIKMIKSFLTNMANRLIIISIEDVGIGNPALPLYINEKLSIWEKARHSISNAHERRKALVDVVIALVESRKSRELSHIRCVFSQVLEYKNLPTDYVSKFPHIYSFARDNSAYYDSFMCKFNSGSDGCFYWFFKQFYSNNETMSSVLKFIDYAIDTTKKRTVAHMKNTKDNQERRMLDNKYDLMFKTIDVLRLWYKTLKHKEFIMYGMQIILLCLRSNLEYQRYTHDSKYSNISYVSYLEKNLKDGSIEIDDFCIDKHTKTGKKSGKDITDFASDGCLVINEDTNTNQEYKWIYIDYRSIPHDTEKVPVDVGQNDTKQLSNKSASKTKSNQCEGILKTKAKAGERCTFTGKVEVNGKFYCLRHKPTDTSTPQNNTPSDKESKVLPNSNDKNITNTTDNTCNVPICKHIMNNNTKQSLFSNDTYRGQRMTSKYKKQTLIPINGKYKGCIIKGPWIQKEYDKIFTIQMRCEILNKYCTNHIRFATIGDSDMNIYIASKNISIIDPSKWIYETTIDKIVSDNPIKIIHRESMGIQQLQNLTDSDISLYLFGTQFLLKDLIIMCIIKVGDMGLYNILVSNNRAYIIDYEDNSGREKFESFENIFCKKSNKVRTILYNGIQNNKEKVISMIKDIDLYIHDIRDMMNKYKCNKVDPIYEWTCIKESIMSLL